MMKTWIVIGISVILVLSFLLVFLLSPTDSEFLSQFKDENYVTLAEFDAPTDGQRILNISTNIPMSFKIEKRDMNRVLVGINKNLSNKSIDYIRANLDASFSLVPEEGRHANLELDITSPLIYFKAESFNLVKMYTDYKKLFDTRQYVELRVYVPMNYVFEVR